MLLVKPLICPPFPLDLPLALEAEEPLDMNNLSGSTEPPRGVPRYLLLGLAAGVALCGL